MNISRIGLLAFVALVDCTRPSTGSPPQPLADCNAPSRDASISVATPGNPFQALPSIDGCWVFVSIARGANERSAIALYRRSAGTLAFVRELRLAGSPAGMALTSDGKLLVVADNDRVAFIDTDRLIAGQGSAIMGYLVDTSAKGRVYANVTADNKYAFIADENSATVSIIDLDKARSTRFAASSTVGKIATGPAPIALTFSPDQRLIYITSQRAPAGYRWPIECKREANNPANDVTPVNPSGAIHVVDVERAKRGAANAITVSVPAGCSPVRLALSPDGSRAYVTARNSNALLVFETAKMLTDPEGALMARVPVGSSPVGVAVINAGRQVVVTNSNRFAGGGSDGQSLTLIDAAKVAEGAGAVIGSVPAGTFPRELRVTTDGRTLILTNFGSQTVQLVDLTRTLAGLAR
jgi:DNA-binding beta-propeller fold protein YncE